MQIRVLGCSGSIAHGSRTSSFLVDDDLLVDAGTGVGELSLDELARIDDILLSHSHLDHVLGVPLLADSVMRRRAGRRPIRIHALPATLEVLRRHLFNDLLWPDFTRLPCPGQPVLTLQPLAVGERLCLGRAGRVVDVLPAAHSVPACGYAVQSAGGRAWVYTGDTGPNPALWATLAGRPVAQLVIEIAFAEGDATIAADAQHHCPSTLAAELAWAPPEAEILLTHVKPGEQPTIEAELAARLPGRRWRCLRTDERLQVD